MPDPALVDSAANWVAGALVLWVGGAIWVTAVASHLELSEWRWFALALATGPVAWIAMFMRLRHRGEGRRGSPARSDASVGGAADR